MTAVDVAAIRARCEAATPGPWESDGDYDRAEVCQAGGDWATVVGTEEVGHGHLRHDRLVLRAADSQFVAHARTDVPALLSALEAAVSRAEVAETALGRVEALHQRGEASFVDASGFCVGCNYEWPCPTVAAVRGDAT